jgi:integrase
LQARKVIADIFAVSNHDALQSSTIQDYCDAWLKRKDLEAGEKTHVRYAGIIENFLTFLGPRANKDLAHLRAKDIGAFRDSLARRLTPGSANISLKVVRSALAQARRDGLVDVNEAERVTLLKNVHVSRRRPFTVPEVKCLLTAAHQEWRGMILTGVYTGLRLSDIARLTWANVDLQTKEISIVTGKTGRRQILPLAKTLLSHLKSLTNSGLDSPLFPDAYAARQRSQYGGTLSNQFYNILVAAGLAERRTHEGAGKGRDAKRDMGVLSFHCLRHTATSLLKNAGVSDAVARDIIGHESPAISANYTKIDTKTKRAALNKIPDVLA